MHVCSEKRAWGKGQGQETVYVHRCETRNHLWLVLEYCVGGDLYTLLKEEPVLSEDSIHGFAHDIALALQHVHANGLVGPSCFAPYQKCPC